MSLLLLTQLCFSLRLTGQENNPFIPLLKKTYPHYSEEYAVLRGQIINNDFVYDPKLVDQFYEAAKLVKTPEWKLNVSFFDCAFRFYVSRKGGLVVTGNYTTNDYIADMQSILVESEKYKIKHIEIDALFQIAESYRIYLSDQGKAFEYYMKLDKVMSPLSMKDYPVMLYNNLQIGSFLFYFKDYKNAIIYFNKILKEPLENSSYYYVVRSVYNHLGLSYRYGLNDIDQSDYYFYQILAHISKQRTSIGHDEIWEGIAKGNLGHNLILRDKYDDALPLLLFSFERMLKYNDYSYASGKAIDIATVLFYKKQIAEAKKYIDYASEYMAKSQRNDKKKDLFPLLSRYYAALGNNIIATAYLDSTISAINEYNQELSAIKLRHVEQQMHIVENQAKEQALNYEKEKSNSYYRTLVISFSSLFFLIVLLVTLILLYQKKKSAYRELVRRSLQWAEVNPEKEFLQDYESIEEEKINNSVVQINDSDLLLVQRLTKLFEDEKTYINPDITLDILSRHLDTNRVQLSQAINRSEKKNFNLFINEYRIKEAIKIMSSIDSINQTIDSIAYDSGFNDRKAFYRVFKKITGLSPSDFRKNMEQ